MSRPYGQDTVRELFSRTPDAKLHMIEKIGVDRIEMDVDPEPYFDLTLAEAVESRFQDRTLADRVEDEAYSVSFSVGDNDEETLEEVLPKTAEYYDDPYEIAR